MSVAAMLDLGIEPDYLVKELEKIHLQGYELSIRKKSMRGITGTDFDVILTENEPEHAYAPYGHEHPHDNHVSDDAHTHSHDAYTHAHDAHTHSHDDHAHVHDAHAHPHGDHAHSHDNAHTRWCEIRKLIAGSELGESVKKLAVNIFTRVAEAEAKVHGVSVEAVEFHEVGAVDSIVDIVSFAILFDAIHPDRVIIAPMNTGSGTVKCRHGVLPVPAPATSEILAQRNAAVYSSGIKGELITPTGAAIACEIAHSFGTLPAMCIEKVGYGTGKKDFGVPNVLRAILGTVDETRNDEVMVMEANIDDMTGEIAGFTLERLMLEGALDAFYTPVYMKKNRPAVKLTVLTGIEHVSKLERIILSETTTIGIRKYRVSRTVMDRTSKTVELPYGQVMVKQCAWEDIKRYSVEFESAKKLALEAKLPLQQVYRDAMAAIGE